MDIDLEKDPLGTDAEGNPVFYADIVPAADEVAALVDEFVTADLYEQGAANMFEGDAAWQALGACLLYTSGEPRLRNSAYWPRNFGRRGAAGCERPRGGSGWRPQRNGPSDCLSKTQDSAKPVSYTHLDVYKRQRRGFEAE